MFRVIWKSNLPGPLRFPKITGHNFADIYTVSILRLPYQITFLIINVVRTSDDDVDAMTYVNIDRC